MKYSSVAFGLAGLLSLSSGAYAGTTSVELLGFGINGLGSFEATATYDDEAFTLSILLENTSEEEGFLTAFAFNNPGNAVTDVTGFVRTDADFRLLGGPSYDDSVNSSPLGYFDVGASTGRSWEGGGAPSAGIAVGDAETFTFTFAGTDLHLLTASSFFGAAGELSAPTGGGDGYMFAVRFRGFECEPDCAGSDKAPGDVVPVPPAVALFLTGIGMLVAYSRRRKIAVS